MISYLNYLFDVPKSSFWFISSTWYIEIYVIILVIWITICSSCYYSISTLNHKIQLYFFLYVILCYSRLSQLAEILVCQQMRMLYAVFVWMESVRTVMLSYSVICATQQCIRLVFCIKELILKSNTREECCETGKRGVNFQIC